MFKLYLPLITKHLFAHTQPKTPHTNDWFHFGRGITASRREIESLLALMFCRFVICEFHGSCGKPEGRKFVFFLENGCTDYLILRTIRFERLPQFFIQNIKIAPTTWLLKFTSLTLLVMIVSNFKSQVIACFKCGNEIFLICLQTHKSEEKSIRSN